MDEAVQEETRAICLILFFFFLIPQPCPASAFASPPQRQAGLITSERAPPGMMDGPQPRACQERVQGHMEVAYGSS